MDRIAAVMLVRDDGAVLMQHRDDKPGLRAAGQWVPPGGHCENGENVEEGAYREFFEETGYSCKSLTLICHMISDNDPGWPPQDLTLFAARYDGVQEISCFEGQAVEFLARNSVEDYLIPGYILQIWDRVLKRFSVPNPN
jgi:8-oxo-dGTP pyrophosphatase MutT (NUDIX family)